MKSWPSRLLVIAAVAGVAGCATWARWTHKAEPTTAPAPPAEAAPAHVMLTPGAIDATARACFEMHRAREHYRPLDAGVRAAPLDDAYRIQDALHRLMAEAGRGEIAGWKIALTSKAMQQMTGVDQPAGGAIFSKVVHASPARVDLAAYHHLGVEFEVAVRLAEPLPAAGGPIGARARARPATPWATRSRPWRGWPTCSTAAAACSSAACS